jgi:hypothetical protein
MTAFPTVLSVFQAKYLPYVCKVLARFFCGFHSKLSFVFVMNLSTLKLFDPEKSGRYLCRTYVEDN